MEDLLMSSINLKLSKKKKGGGLPARVKDVFETEKKNEIAEPEKELEKDIESEKTEKPKRTYKRKTKAAPKVEDPDPIETEETEVTDDE